MKEKAIIFSSEMIRAILDGRKTQIRRVIKPQPTKGREEIWPIALPKESWKQIKNKRICPYGKVGDRLWVRETWRVSIIPHAMFRQTQISYKADGSFEWKNAPKISTAHFAWVSPIFMPRWASRITLEITDIRVERLREISGEEAIREGCVLAEGYEELINTFFKNPYVEAFRDLWNSLAKKGFKWENNPWIWIIEFRNGATHDTK